MVKKKYNGWIVINVRGVAGLIGGDPSLVGPMSVLRSGLELSRACGSQWKNMDRLVWLSGTG